MTIDLENPMNSMNKYRALARKLRRNESGLALVEFAVSLPFFMFLTIAGFESANYAYVVMKINQLTINTADGASRIGEGDQLSAKKITEKDINDIFAGTIREGSSILLGGQHSYKDPGTGEVSLRGNALIILSSVEPVDAAVFDPDAPRFRIRWQRCLGSADFYQSNYGTVGTPSSFTEIGPEGRKIVPPNDTAIMFVETQYYFRPAILNGFTKLTDQTIKQTAAMIVRERRDYNGGNNGVYPEPGVTASTCGSGT
jgi:hypothetical protein